MQEYDIVGNQLIVQSHPIHSLPNEQIKNNRIELRINKSLTCCPELLKYEIPGHFGLSSH